MGYSGGYLDGSGRARLFLTGGFKLVSLSKLEVQRIMERLGKLEGQVAGLISKVNAFETILKPDNLWRRVRDGEIEEKRKLEREQLLAGEGVLQPKAPGHPG